MEKFKYENPNYIIYKETNSNQDINYSYKIYFAKNIKLDISLDIFLNSNLFGYITFKIDEDSFYYNCYYMASRQHSDFKNSISDMEESLKTAIPQEIKNVFENLCILYKLNKNLPNEHPFDSY
jgi:hypothetical protein